MVLGNNGDPGAKANWPTGSASSPRGVRGAHGKNMGPTVKAWVTTVRTWGLRLMGGA